MNDETGEHPANEEERKGDPPATSMIDTGGPQRKAPAAQLT